MDPLLLYLLSYEDNQGIYCGNGATSILLPIFMYGAWALGKNPIIVYPLFTSHSLNLGPLECVVLHYFQTISPH